MKYYHLLVSIFEKEIGNLIEEKIVENGMGGVLSAEFIYQNKINVKIIIIEVEEGTWVIHHELSREDPILLKKVGYLCGRIQRIGDTKQISILLSEDLQDVQQQNIFTTTIKCGLQNVLNLFTLFNAQAANERKSELTKTTMKQTRSNIGS